MLFLVLFAGCASTHVAVKKDSSFLKYKKIYLHESKSDPRKVLPKVRQHLEQLGFQVAMVDEDESIGGNQGTGFAISRDGYILTSAHIFGKEEEATVWLNDKRYEADIVLIEKEDEKDDVDVGDAKNIKEALQASLDSESNKSILESTDKKSLALLKIRSQKEALTPVVIADQDGYQIGQEVYTVGFPLSSILGDEARLNKGFISSTVGIKDNPDFVQISVEVQPGNSGGPLLNDKGQVVGIVEMTLNPLRVLSATKGALPQNVNFAIKNNVIRKFLDKYPDKARLRLQDSGQMSFDDVQKSVAKIHSGIVTEGFKKEAKLACSVSYASFWDIWHRFTYLDIIFYDVDTEEILLRAGQYGDSPFSTENKTLDEVFKDIEGKIGYR